MTWSLCGGCIDFFFFPLSTRSLPFLFFSFIEFFPDAFFFKRVILYDGSTGRRKVWLACVLASTPVSG